MSNIKEIIIDFVKSSYPVKLDVLAQTVSRKSSTFNYNLFEILNELIKEKNIYVLKNDEIYFIFPESIEIVTSMFSEKKKVYKISIVKYDFIFDFEFDTLPRLADLIDMISSLKTEIKNFNKVELLELLNNNYIHVESNWPETNETFYGSISLNRNYSISIHFSLN